MSPKNSAAWLTGPMRTPLEVKESAYISPGPNEILIKNAAVAINPIDWAIQDRGPVVFPHLKYPLVLGTDCAGTVVEVGSAVMRIEAGDRVLGHATGLTSNNPSAAAFQQFVILPANLVAKIPASLSFTAASVLPLCFSTAACGLFQKDYLSLQHPSVPAKSTGEALLVWGGATSVGTNAVQLAVAAGYEVISTSSPKNFAYVRELGASDVYDYNSPSVTADLIEAFKATGKKLAGAFNVAHILSTSGNDPFASCCEVILAINGPSGGFVATAMRATPGQVIPEGITSKMIFGSTLAGNEVGEAVYENFLEIALEKGNYRVLPEALVVGNGLESVQEALRVQKEGVSARKVVVSLQ